MTRNHSALRVPARRRRKKVAGKPSARRQPKIVLTGERSEGRYQIVFEGKIIEIPFSSLSAMIDLVVARGQAGNGYARINPVVIFRLRRAIDTAICAGTGRELIQSGALDEYRLTIPRDQLYVDVALSPCFVELVKLDLVSTEQVMELRSFCGNVSNEIQK